MPIKDMAALAAKFRNAEKITLHCNKSERYAEKSAVKAKTLVPMGKASDIASHNVKCNPKAYGNVREGRVEKYTIDGEGDKPLPRERERVVPVYATPRPDSPFKRSGKALSSVVVVRKKIGKP